ncbi:hypothetical protein [Microbacterium sp. 2FI]|uniref:hypothetical protein n=1 Tax=Microbacterium sp. 2FI TaxID=2502193 RepID=UPI0010F52C48|nr:hypothetical protein [Microbacterium sp. 2FI]
MSRPGNWSLVGYPSDPVPGDPSLVQTIGRLYVGTADSIDRAATNLTTALGDDFGRAKVLDAIRDQAEEVARRITMAEERYRGVGDAMIAYAAVLSQAQQDSADALADAEAAETTASSARWWVDHYQERFDDPATPPANVPNLTSQLGIWQDRLGAAGGAQAGAESAVATAVGNRDAAAGTAIADIRLVESSGDLNDGFWDNVSQWVAEHKDVLDIIGNVLGAIAAIAAIAMLFIPGLNLLAIGILITANLVYQALNSGLQVATGNMSMGEAILNVGLAALNFVGAGAALKMVAGTAKASAVVGARASIAGMTRVGSRQYVAGLVRTATPATMTRETTQVMKILGLNTKSWAAVDVLASLRVGGRLVAPEAWPAMLNGMRTIAILNGVTTGAGIALNGTVGELLPQPVLPWRLHGDPEFVGTGLDGTPIVVSEYGRW